MTTGRLWLAGMWRRGTAGMWLMSEMEKMEFLNQEEWNGIPGRKMTLEERNGIPEPGRTTWKLMNGT